ncbi:hypothetical protein BGW38_000783 [Lunasporangiospora selenospora]|uniref:Protection of telomeres protein 1 ssDNA-binding domain-containing protein n=1 Tax=Lunasporangiospora selenospora TaxID=979761 RepID=A0A9P6FWI9_9FUNG|nr:hypothetical protein BGW38_000783 [Lunasporangiospora selenospora]
MENFHPSINGADAENRVSILAKNKPLLGLGSKLRTVSQLEIRKFCDFIGEVIPDTLIRDVQAYAQEVFKDCITSSTTIVMTDYTEHDLLPFQDGEGRPMGQASILITLWDEHSTAATEMDIRVGHFLHLKNLLAKVDRQNIIQLSMNGYRGKGFQQADPIAILDPMDPLLRDLRMRKARYEIDLEAQMNDPNRGVAQSITTSAPSAESTPALSVRPTSDNEDNGMKHDTTTTTTMKTTMKTTTATITENSNTPGNPTAEPTLGDCTTAHTLSEFETASASGSASGSASASGSGSGYRSNTFPSPKSPPARKALQSSQESTTLVPRLKREPKSDLSVQKNDPPQIKRSPSMTKEEEASLLRQPITSPTLLSPPLSQSPESPTLIDIDRLKNEVRTNHDAGIRFLKLRVHVIGYYPKTLVDFVAAICDNCRQEYEPLSGMKELPKKCPRCRRPGRIGFHHNFQLKLRDELGQIYDAHIDEPAAKLLGVENAQNPLKKMDSLRRLQQQLEILGVSFNDSASMSLTDMNDASRIWFDCCLRLKRYEKPEALTTSARPLAIMSSAAIAIREVQSDEKLADSEICGSVSSQDSHTHTDKSTYDDLREACTSQTNTSGSAGEISGTQSSLCLYYSTQVHHETDHSTNHVSSTIPSKRKGSSNKGRHAKGIADRQDRSGDSGVEPCMSPASAVVKSVHATDSNSESSKKSKRNQESEGIVLLSPETRGTADHRAYLAFTSIRR